MVQRTTLQPRLSDIYPLELHAVFCSAGRWGQGFILQKETSLESQTAMGEGWTRGRGAERGSEGGGKSLRTHGESRYEWTSHAAAKTAAASD